MAATFNIYYLKVKLDLKSTNFKKKKSSEERKYKISNNDK